MSFYEIVNTQNYEGKEYKGVQMGGPSGGCIPVDQIDTPVDLLPAVSTVFTVNVYSVPLFNPVMFVVVVPFFTFIGCG